MSPLINFTTTTAFDRRQKTSTWEKQPTDGGEGNSGRMCFDTDPGTHILPPFMLWSRPAPLQKKVEEWGRREERIKKNDVRCEWRELQVWPWAACYDVRETERASGRKRGGKRVFGPQCILAHGHLCACDRTHSWWHNAAKAESRLHRLKIREAADCRLRDEKYWFWNDLPIWTLKASKMRGWGHILWNLCVHACVLMSVRVVFAVLSGSFKLKQPDRAALYETGSRAWTETGPANSKTHTSKTYTHTHSANKFQHLSLALYPVNTMSHATHLTLPVCLSLET